MKFRKRALESLESPEQLDEVARLAPVPAWLTALALTLVVVAAGAWSVFGTVPKTVSASGVLTRASGVSTVDATRAGLVTGVLARSGERLEKGQALYELTDDGGTVTVGSPWTAYVVGTLVSPGQWVETGTGVANLERLDTPDDRVRAVVYVAASAARSVRAGMRVELTGVPGAGVVREVGSFPETADSLRAFLGRTRDVTPFLAGGPVVAVIVEPTGDLARSQGVVTARITIADERPVDWLFP
ncbi:HlyD family efflux transporter periplasmic adaptor subunit [Saccharothrix violaceirubra]|uniref:Multidrug efflux pump subunit AcrA (Membrane-fusion protein) n=1 Tax=Saccharothrix violaceirubra TaxID=413306 RepID=A0A7W7T329_9PSEU|nr:HlyD family efflux transporter periplasmic adaptor subunit [Saccharothrix violaceirubra]MBB4965351.1 multidrug efflux pump subunit AcrA (membrane-fusion protein) [Saccharothrix violaceirubra]